MVIDQIQLQRASEGRPLDDVIVHAHDRSGTKAVLEIQVKKEPRFRGPALDRLGRNPPDWSGAPVVGAWCLEAEEPAAGRGGWGVPRRRVDAEEAVATNGAQRLVELFAELRAVDPNAVQREPLMRVLKIEPTVRNTATLLERLAHLHRLPTRIARELVATGAPGRFLEWQHAVLRALEQLDGGHRSKMSACIGGEGLGQALVELEMVAAFLDQNDRNYDQAALTKALEDIDALLAEVEDDNPDLDSELQDWLTDTLKEMRHVVLTALSVGIEAAKKEMYALAGRTKYEPCPEATSDVAAGYWDRTTKLADSLAPLVRVVDAVRGVAGFLQGG